MWEKVAWKQLRTNFVISVFAALLWYCHANLYDNWSLEEAFCLNERIFLNSEAE